MSNNIGRKCPWIIIDVKYICLVALQDNNQISLPFIWYYSKARILILTKKASHITYSIHYYPAHIHYLYNPTFLSWKYCNFALKIIMLWTAFCNIPKPHLWDFHFCVFLKKIASKWTIWMFFLHENLEENTNMFTFLFV